MLTPKLILRCYIYLVINLWFTKCNCSLFIVALQPHRMGALHLRTERTVTLDEAIAFFMRLQELVMLQSMTNRTFSHFEAPAGSSRGSLLCTTSFWNPPWWDCERCWYIMGFTADQLCSSRCYRWDLGQVELIILKTAFGLHINVMRWTLAAPTTTTYSREFHRIRWQCAAQRGGHSRRLWATRRCE